jgi:hypothetical protein
MAVDNKLSTAVPAIINSSVPSSSANSISKSVDPTMSEHKEAYVPDPEKDVTPDQDVTEKELSIVEAENAGVIISPSEEEEEYPKSWRLGLITIALCLSVFCMALGV